MTTALYWFIMDKAISKVRAVQQLRQAFVIAREKMNAAIPDVVEATPAERALYDERYKADHEAERAFRNAALEVFQDGSIDALLDRIRDSDATRSAEPFGLGSSLRTAKRGPKASPNFHSEAPDNG